MKSFGTSDLDELIARAEYKSEGNANVVFSLNNKYVIRVPKLSDVDKRGMERNVEYIKIFKRIMTSCEVLIPEIKEIHSPLNVNRHRLNQIVSRYSKRHSKVTEPIVGKYAYLYPDATYLHIDTKLLNSPVEARKTYSAEIKPKQGWPIHASHYADNVQLPEHLIYCRYCVKQYLKLKNNVISEISGYCPLDLFSGNLIKMKRVICSALENPQNNFKFFVNGGQKMTTSEITESFEEGDLDLLNSILCHLLLFKKGFQNEEQNRSGGASELCVLEEIQRLQLLVKENSNCNKRNVSLTENTYDYLQPLIDKNPQSVEELSPVEKYMVGATMLDCSIFLTFQIRHPSDVKSDFSKNNRLDLDSNRTIIFNIIVVDLDPKPDNHFLKYFHTTKRAYENALEFSQRNTK